MTYKIIYFVTYSAILILLGMIDINSSIVYWLKYDLGQKYYAPQVRPD